MSSDKFDYTRDEVRAMLAWELAKYNKDGDPIRRAEISNLARAFKDEMISMWESAGLTARTDLQQRVETYRNAMQNETKKGAP